MRLWVDGGLHGRAVLLSQPIATFPDARALHPARGAGFRFLPAVWESAVHEDNYGHHGQGVAACAKRPAFIADRSEAHVLVIAPTGAGKGRNFIIPNLLSSTAPAIVLDIKGEAARVTDRYCAESVETAAFHFQFSYLSRLCRIWVYRFRLVQLR